jgi:hypothetical protein
MSNVDEESGESLALEYRKVVLETIQNDIRRVHVRVTAALGTVAAIVTQIDLATLRGLTGWRERLMLIGVGLLVGAAALYFQYTQELNKARIRIASNPAYTPSQVRQAWSPFLEERPIWRGRHPTIWYQLGQVLFITGGVFLLLVVIGLLRK